MPDKIDIELDNQTITLNREEENELRNILNNREKNRNKNSANDTFRIEQCFHYVYPMMITLESN